MSADRLPPGAPWLARHYGAVLLTALAAKILIAWTLPITGDEAYFLIWGQNPDLGYYDHPPMVGWWLSLVLAISDHPLAIRALGIAVSMAPALLILALWHRQDPVRARLVSLIALFMPLLFIAVLTATDTPLLLFGLLATGLTWHALRTGRHGWFLLAGIALGLAFLSKYFAVLLGIALGLHILLFAPRHWRGLLLIILGVVPAVALNLYWNWDNCWYNVMFNIVNRHGGDGIDPANLLAYAVMLVYVFTPWLLWFIAREFRALGPGIREHSFGVFLSAGLIPLAVFALLAPFKSIGLHWLAVFVPFLLLPALFLSTRALNISAWLSAILAGLHAAVLLTIALMPVEWLKDHERYPDAVFYLAPQSVADAVGDYGPEWHLFTRSYSRSAVLAYYTGRDVGVFDQGSHYGRQDDLLTDFRDLDGADLLYIPSRGDLDREQMEPFFDAVHVQEVTIRGVDWSLAEGRGFDYRAYRDEVLDPVLERYYDFPDWLPEGRCAFTERYSRR
ncbi:ArnT family glycosyltransferase [Thioalkalivibrio thiocyanoxidans]|uniref:ArnT family glycosyltransferase n=1 Tax=Thioalkalivibrio thiocyanoxidans TaxID=152475 RepID=UPI00036E17A2|nr:glycosyltransferase family 39 protein [Thioalkalivibrio thiocyanoxidans]